MADYFNPTDMVTVGTDGDDTFTITDRGPVRSRSVTGGAGNDLLIVDRGFDTASTLIISQFSGDPYFFGRIDPAGPYDNGVVIFNQFESIRFTGTSGNDTARITLDQGAIGTSIDLNVGAGEDLLGLDLSGFTSNVSFFATTPTIDSSFGRFSGFDRFEIFGGAGDDVIHTGDGNDSLRGGAGTNILHAGGGDDTIYSISTTDFTDGGTGRDFWTGNYGDQTGAMTVELGDTVVVDGRTVAINVEMLTLGTGSGSDTINLTTVGYAVIYGGDGFDTLNFLPATDQIDTVTIGGRTDGRFNIGINSTGAHEIERVNINGGTMDDIFRLNGVYAASALTLNGGSGNDTLTADFRAPSGATFFVVNGDGTVDSNRGTFIDFETFTISGGGAADLIQTGAGNDHISGEEGDDILLGGGGDDGIVGGVGADQMFGGTGDDRFYVEDAGDIVFEYAGEGIDTVQSNASHYLHANVENLLLTSVAANGFGVGNELANSITGNDGANLLIGGAGDDVVRGANGADSIFGEGGDDQLYGDYGIDYLAGGSGNDRLDGDLEPDALYGEDGDDILIGGWDFATDILVGGAGNDVLRGDGGLGDYDLMDGGAGDDSFYVDTPDDLTFEAANGGIDTVYATINGAGYYLYANVENLVLGGNTPFGVGNELNNRITGSDASNWLLGGAGDDVLDGRGGNDVLFGEAGADIFVFAQGTGADVIGDFVAGTDRIDLSAFGFTSFAQVEAVLGENGGTSFLTLGDGDMIVLNGVARASLSAGDFILASVAVNKLPVMEELDRGLTSGLTHDFHNPRMFVDLV